MLYTYIQLFEPKYLEQRITNWTFYVNSERLQPPKGAALLLERAIKREKKNPKKKRLCKYLQYLPTTSSKLPPIPSPSLPFYVYPLFSTLCLFVYDGQAPSKDRPTSLSSRLEIFFRKKKTCCSCQSESRWTLTTKVYDFIGVRISGHASRWLEDSSYGRENDEDLTGGDLFSSWSRWPTCLEELPKVRPIYELVKKKKGKNI